MRQPTPSFSCISQPTVSTHVYIRSDVHYRITKRYVDAAASAAAAADACCWRRRFYAWPHNAPCLIGALSKWMGGGGGRMGRRAHASTDLYVRSGDTSGLIVIIAHASVNTAAARASSRSIFRRRRRWRSFVARCTWSTPTCLSLSLPSHLRPLDRVVFTTAYAAVGCLA